MKCIIRIKILPFAFLTIVFIAVSGAEERENLSLRTVPIFTGEKAFRARLQASSPDKEPLGILLSGGSARAYAHIGVLKRLEEADVKPDFIVANSMGAIVALLYATGMAPSDIESLISATPMADLFGSKVPFGGGIINSYRLMDVLHDLFGDIRIEDLPIPVLIVCEDLASKRQVWITEGDFYTVMRAAFSLPVYFDPVPFESFILVDGGTINLVPVDVLANLTDRMIVAATFYRADRPNYRNPLTILNLNFSISKERSAVAMLKKYDPPFIRCAVEDLSFMDYQKIDLIVRRGYESTDREIDAILARVGRNPRPDPDTRASLARRKTITQRRISAGAPLLRQEGRAYARIALEFPYSFNSPYHFIKDPYVALLLVAEQGPITVATGPSCSLIDAEPAASAFVRFGPFGIVSLDSYSRFAEEYRYAQATVRALFYLPYPVVWMPFAETEILSDSAWKTDDGYRRGGIACFATDNRHFRPEITFYAFSKEPDIYGIGAESSLAVSPFYPLEFRARAIGRYGLSESDEFTPFGNDGYRGIMHDDKSLPNAILNAEIALNANRVSFGLAETILLQRFYAAVFLDVIEARTRSIAVGANITATVSLIGLSPLTVSVFGGWDVTEEAPFLAAKVGSLFRDRTR